MVCIMRCMGKQAFWRRNWKLILNIVTVVAMVALIVAIRDQLLETFRNIRHVNGWFLLLVPLLQAANYHAQTKQYQTLFAVLGNMLSYRQLMRASLEINFVNHVFPSGGVSGTSYFGIRLRDDSITGGRATLVQIMKVALLILSFEVVLIAGLLILALNNRANNFTILVTSSITTLMLIGTLLFGYVIGSKKRISSTFTALTRLLNTGVRFFRPEMREAINVRRVEQIFEELHNNYVQIRAKWRELKWPWVWALAANVTEVLSIYAVYLAFGEWVNIGAVILAYAVANFAGFVSVMPGGVGIYEALMTGVLVASGVPAGISLPVTVMYRVLNTLIQVPPGYYLYHKALQEAPSAAAATEAAVRAESSQSIRD